MTTEFKLTEYKPSDFEIPKYGVPVEIADFGMKRLIVVGDIHGCSEELSDLGNKIKPTSNDIVIFAGDLVDRGPYSAEVLRAVRLMCCHTPSRYCVLGNHDEKHVRYRKHLHKAKLDPGYKIPMKSREPFLTEHLKMTDEDLAWAAKLPAVIQVRLAFNQHENEVRVVTHAGLLPNLWYRQATSGLIRNRYVDSVTFDPKAMKRGSAGEYIQPDGTVVWDELHTGNERIITGHIVHDLEKVRIHNNCYGIDTGACFGGHLTAYVEDLRSGKVEFVQVPARETYFDRNHNEEA